MTTLQELRKRIRTAKNVEQITKAMEAVATAQLRGAAKKAEQSINYSKSLELILSRLAGSTESVSHPFLAERPLKKIALIVVTGDKGLCGAYNDAVLSAADAFLKKPPIDHIELILVGKKAINHYQRRKWKIRKALDHWSGKIKAPAIEKFVSEMTEAYLAKELDGIWVIYTKFESALSRKIVAEKFLPINSTKVKPPISYIFEPSAQDVLSALLPRYCLAKIQRVLDEAYAAELAARAFSMRKATNNAKDMLERLVLVANKIRQASITKEMIEIASGIEGVS